MSARDVPDLSLMCLKIIAKTPSVYINKKALEGPYRVYPKPLLNSVTQLLIDYITEAGRLTDDVFPLDAFDTERTFLSLKNSKISCKYLIEVLKRCPMLTHLDVSGCFPIDDDIAAKVLELCPLLQHLFIRNCRKLTDITLTNLARNAKYITSLSIGGNINMTDVGLQNFILQYPNVGSLEELHLSGLPITPGVLENIGRNCTSLRNLSMGYAIITPQTLESFLDVLGDNLETLSIAWLEPLLLQHDASESMLSYSAAQFMDIVRRCCSRLVDLDLTGMKFVNLALLSQLIEYKYSQMERNPNEWKGLQHIKIKFLPVAKQQLEQLRQTYPDIIFEQ